MNTPIYDVDYFIKKFSAIPEDKWCTGNFKKKDKHCALGHCGMVNTLDATEEATALAGLLNEYLNIDPLIKSGEDDWAFYTVYPLNDNSIPRYSQPTAKQRMLSALHDIKKLQEPKPKEVIRYVSVSESLKKQTKELIEN